MLREKLGDLNRKSLIFITITVFLFLTAFAFAHSFINISQNRKMAKKYLESITLGVREAVDSWLGEQKKFIKMVGGMPVFRHYLVNCHKGVSPDYMRELAMQMRHHPDLFLAGRDGKMVMSSHFNSNKKVLNIKDTPFWKGFESSGFGAFLHGDISRSPVTGKLVCVVVSGVKDNSGSIIGFVGRTIDWEKFIGKFILSVKVGKSGYVAITGLNGKNIGHPDKRLNLIDLSNHSWMQKIIEEKNGYQKYTFQGVPKIMAYRESLESGWIVNTSINEEELIEGAILTRKIIIIICVICLVIMILLIGYIDASKLGKARKELEESEKKYRLIFNMGNDGIFVHKIIGNGEPGKFREVNTVFEDMFLCSGNLMEQLTADELFTSMGDWDYKSFVEDVIRNKYRMMEVEFSNCKGKKMVAEFRAFLLETDNQKALLGFVRDITERIVSRRMLRDHCERLDVMVKNRTKELAETNVMLKQQILEKEKAGRDLKESEEKYRSLVERANDGIILIKDRKLIFANRRAQEMLGYEDKELLNLDFLTIIPAHRQGAMEMIYRKRMDGVISSSIYETTLLKKNGDILDVEVNAGLVNYEGRSADFVFVRDITERKKVERERQKHQEELIQADKLVALGTLVSGVAHEINNPNNAIMLNSPILLKAWEDVSPMLQEYFDTNGDFLISGMLYSQFKDFMPEILRGVQDSSSRIKNIVEGLKNFARPSSLEMDEDVDVNMVVESSARLIANQVSRYTDNFSLSLNSDEPLVKGNFQRLEQVVVNLIQNACHALKDRKGSIKIRVKEQEGFVRIEIKDDGAGISSTNMGKIMDPFFTTKRETGGTGLGLSVSMGIIKTHGGTLQLESKEGEGTTAVVILPVSSNGGKV